MLAHTIEAIVDKKITRVHCNTCRAQHTYRAAPPGLRAAPKSGTARRRSTSTKRTSRSAPTVLQASDYEALMRGRDPSRARPYALRERFVPKELIAHPTFGLGLVTAARDGTKIEVLFPDGLKTLAHSQ